ncbi:Meiotically up-regulated gene 87 protein [Zancudomyces culisetae]|uniref:Nuclear pore protein n=1 Tax=Zancudomyces culisetae TaxID=1213189 RepID=A0A1R1PC96_ZANCU|nr:Meiotically up-regulated gene 87 protein [Zancudomyces culisetae]OMH79273.1 Meiotically up-regulated gene 87 protein [Zancudomyces culisetae]|eukprot:OMH78561.1 Meiotically up-regulated gene 87 protein [Zancudomyces culisetae]
MTQQFEKGISYLLQQRERDTQDYYLVDAVHFATILGYNGLLNIAQDEYNYGHNYEYFLESELDYYLVGKSKVDESKCVKLNFNKLILDYAMALHRFYENKAKMDKKFNHVHSVGLGANDYTPMMGPVATELTMHYILLLSLPSLTDNNTKEAQTQQQQLDVCIRAINKYLYESSDFQYYQYYLGDILKDGTQQKGLLQRYRQLLGLSNKEQFDAAITQKLASKNIEEGKLTEGIMLYNLSEQYETVLHILTNKLGNELYRMLSAQHNEGMASAQDYNSTQFQLMCKSPQYLEYYELTQTVLQYYFKSSIDKTFKQPATVLSGLLLLVEFARFVSAYSGGNYEQGLEIIAGCSILPTFSSTTNLASAPDTIRISSMADSLVRTYDDYVLRLVPHIMLLTMRCLVSLYARYKSPQLKTMANNLVVFSGLSQLKMNSSVFAELGRMNSLLL